MPSNKVLSAVLSLTPCHPVPSSVAAGVADKLKAGVAQLVAEAEAELHAGVAAKASEPETQIIIITQPPPG